MNEERATAAAMLTMLLGMCLIIAGVYLLAGIGWALLCSALPLFATSALLLRGVKRGE